MTPAVRARASTADRSAASNLLAGTIAKTVRRGGRVGLCDLTAGEMGSNGTVDERCRIDDWEPRQRRRRTEDFARGSMEGVPSLVMFFSRGMAVQRPSVP